MTMNNTNVIPEETLIYKELKSKFEVSYPELWKDVESNLKQVIESKSVWFEDDKYLDVAFLWSATKQGQDYWNAVFEKCNYVFNKYGYADERLN